MSKAKAGRTWMQRHVADPYVRKAKALGYRSRAAFKLAEIDRADRLFALGPQEVTPGSKMPLQRMPDPSQRAALIDFLRRQTEADNSQSKGQAE